MFESNRKAHRIERDRELAKIRYENDKENRLAINKAWNDAHPEQSKQYKQNHVARMLQEDSNYHKNRKKRASVVSLLFANAKARAIRYGREFDITKEDIIIPTHCPILGIPLVRAEGKMDGSPSLDRFDNNLGYTKGNIRVISWKANHLKGANNLETLKLLTKYLES